MFVLKIWGEIISDPWLRRWTWVSRFDYENLR